MGALNPREVAALTSALLRHLVGPAEMSLAEIDDVSGAVAREVIGSPGPNKVKQAKLKEAKATVMELLSEAVEP